VIRDAQAVQPAPAALRPFTRLAPQVLAQSPLFLLQSGLEKILLAFSYFLSLLRIYFGTPALVLIGQRNFVLGFCTFLDSRIGVFRPIWDAVAGFGTLK